jgi:hypothetical protein
MFFVGPLYPINNGKEHSMTTHAVTPDLLTAYVLCRRKAFLLLHGENGL